MNPPTTELRSAYSQPAAARTSRERHWPAVTNVTCTLEEVNAREGKKVTALKSPYTGLEAAEGAQISGYFRNSRSDPEGRYS